MTAFETILFVILSLCMLALGTEIQTLGGRLDRIEQKIGLTP